MSTDGTMIAMIEMPREKGSTNIGLYDLTRERRIATLSGREGQDLVLSFSGDNRHLIGHNDRGEIVVWDIQWTRNHQGTVLRDLCDGTLPQSAQTITIEDALFEPLATPHVGRSTCGLL